MRKEVGWMEDEALLSRPPTNTPGGLISRGGDYHCCRLHASPTSVSRPLHTWMTGPFQSVDFCSLSFCYILSIYEFEPCALVTGSARQARCVTRSFDHSLAQELKSYPSSPNLSIRLRTLPRLVSEYRASIGSRKAAGPGSCRSNVGSSLLRSASSDFQGPTWNSPGDYHMATMQHLRSSRQDWTN